MSYGHKHPPSLYTTLLPYCFIMSIHNTTAHSFMHWKTQLHAVEHSWVPPKYCSMYVYVPTALYISTLHLRTAQYIYNQNSRLSTLYSSRASAGPWQMGQAVSLLWQVVHTVWPQW